MKTTGAELIDILERIAVLEWYGYSRYERGGKKPTSAGVVWRFDSNRTNNEQVIQIIEMIRSALIDAANIEWGLKYTGRNWVLAPTKIFQLEESGEFKNDGEVDSYIVKNDPDFFTKAHEDLIKISNAVAVRIR